MYMNFIMYYLVIALRVYYNTVLGRIGAFVGEATAAMVAYGKFARIVKKEQSTAIFAFSNS